ALDIFHQRHFETFRVGDFLDNHRNTIESGALRGAKTALADDQFVAVFHPTHHQWLHDALVTNRLGQLSKAVFIKKSPRRTRVRRDLGDRHSPFRGGRSRRSLGDQGAESTAQGTPLHYAGRFAHRSTPLAFSVCSCRGCATHAVGSRRVTSRANSA